MNNKKSTEKRQFRGTPSGSRPAFACRPALRSRQKQDFFVEFQAFFVDLSCEITEKDLKLTKKVGKRLKKSSSTSFQVLKAAESWSKYTIKGKLKIISRFFVQRDRDRKQKKYRELSNCLHSIMQFNIGFQKRRHHHDNLSVLSWCGSVVLGCTFSD